MQQILITGGSGFFGELLIKQLLQDDFFCVNVDLLASPQLHKNLISYQGDIRDAVLMNKICEKYKFDAIIHLAAILAHAVKDKQFLWSSNVDGTRTIAELAKRYKIKKVIFTSSNCLWGESFTRPVTEADIPNPVEIYGKSKLEGEIIIQEYKNNFDYIIFRCPTIIDAGRLGLLSILFEFINESRKVWVVGGGKNKYQFIYAQDLVTAFSKALRFNRSDIFNIGSDHVKSLHEIYSYVIKQTGSRSKVASLPKRLTLLAMKIAYKLKISPLGPYQYKMIAEDFIFDTTKIKKELNWAPTLTNHEMLHKAYQYYHLNRGEIQNRTNVSDHKQSAKMGIIRLLKWFS